MKRQSHMPALISFAIVIGAGLIIYFYLSSQEARESGIVNIMVGAWFSGFTQVLNYWLGATRKDQPADIDQINKKDIVK